MIILPGYEHRSKTASGHCLLTQRRILKIRDPPRPPAPRSFWQISIFPPSPWAQHVETQKIIRHREQQLKDFSIDAPMAISRLWRLELHFEAAKLIRGSFVVRWKKEKKFGEIVMESYDSVAGFFFSHVFLFATLVHELMDYRKKMLHINPENQWRFSKIAH